MDASLVVLLVEDSPDDALLMQRAFKSHGILRPPHVCRNGNEAISYLSGEGVYADRKTYPYPDFLITDLKMPGSDGFDVLAWLRKHPDALVVPTLVWSSSRDASDVKRSYCLGAHGYLCKPTDFQKFKEMVGEMFRFWSRCEKPVPNSGPTCEQLAAKKR